MLKRLATRHLLLVLLLSSTAIWGCSDSSRREAHGGPQAATIILPAKVGAFTPGPGPWIDIVETSQLVFLPLTTVNENGELEGVLARTWELAPDYRSVRVELRDDVFWHDGTPVTAHDIKFTNDLFHHPSLGSCGWSTMHTVTVHDRRTLTISFRQSVAWDYDFGYWRVFLPRHLLENLDPDDFAQWDFWKRPVGNGPYRFSRYVPATALELVANPNHFEPPPRIERVVIRDGGIQDLLAGKADAINILSEADYQVLTDDERFRFYFEFWVDVPNFNAVLWNHRHPLFAEVDVRRALTLALDRAQLASLMMRPPGVRLLDVPYNPRLYFQGQLPDALPFDPDEAQRILVASGWTDQDGDGVREHAASGRRLEFTMIVRQEWQRGAVYMQSQWQRIGARVELIPLENSVLRSRIPEGDFEAALTWFMNDPTSRYGPLHMATSGGYDNPTLVKGFERMLEESDPDRIDEIYQELATFYMRNLPYTFLTAGSETFVAHRRLRGLSTPFRANVIWSLPHLWLEEKAP